MGINVKELIDLSEVVNYIDKTDYSPNLVLEIDLRLVESFATYNSKSGELTIMPDIRDIGSYIISF